MTSGTCILVCRGFEELKRLYRKFREVESEGENFFGLTLLELDPQKRPEYEQWRIRATFNPRCLLFGVVLGEGFDCTWKGQATFVESDPATVAKELKAGVDLEALELAFVGQGYIQ